MNYENNTLEIAKAKVRTFLVHPAELAFMPTATRAEYLFFITCYLEEKRSIEAQEEQMALTLYLDPNFGTESFERKIQQSQEHIKQYIRRLDKLVKAIKFENRTEFDRGPIDPMHGKLEEVECNHEYNSISDYCVKCSQPVVRGYFE